MDVLQPICGGLLIGAAVLLLRATTGQIAGISGLMARAVLPGYGPAQGRAPAWAFLLGLFAVGAFYFRLLGQVTDVTHNPLLLGAGGFLVGLGTRLGNGCTSGHGICGISRGSVRSIAATLTFMATGIITLAIEHFR